MSQAVKYGDKIIIEVATLNMKDEKTAVDLHRLELGDNQPERKNLSATMVKPRLPLQYLKTGK